MWRFIIGRLGQSLLTLLLVSGLAFVLVRMTGNPIDVILPIEASEEMRLEMSRELGLHRSIFVQYALFLEDLVRGDLGTSIRTQKPVMDLLMERLPNSLQLVGASMLVALLIAFPLGILAATKRRSFWDTAARGIALFGQSIPTFWAGIILIYIFSIYFGLLPAGRKGGFANLILPTLTLGLFGFMLAGVVRLLRDSMIAVFDCEYI